MPVEESDAAYVQQLNKGAADILCVKVLKENWEEKGAMMGCKGAKEMLEEAEVRGKGDLRRETQMLLGLLEVWRGSIKKALQRLSNLGFVMPAADGYGTLSKECFISILITATCGMCNLLESNFMLAYEQVKDCMLALRTFSTTPLEEPGARIFSLSLMVASYSLSKLGTLPYHCNEIAPLLKRYPGITAEVQITNKTRPEYDVLKKLLLNGFCWYHSAQHRSGVRSRPLLPPSVKKHPTESCSALIFPQSGTTFVRIAEILQKRGWHVTTAQGKAQFSRKGLADVLSGYQLLLMEKPAAEKLIADVESISLGVMVGPSLKRQAKTVVNYFKGTRCMTLKLKMAELLKYVPGREKWLPATFCLRPGSADERHLFHEAWRTGPKGLWILKPSNGSKGDGILITKSYKECVDHVDSQLYAYPWVAQRYIEEPFLINGRKADIRSWVLINGDFSVHVSRNGVLRTASSEYRVDDYGNELAHLTNHCIQQTAPLYGQYEKGNEMWYGGFRKYLRDVTRGEADFDRDIVPQMDKITATVISEALRGISPPRHPLKGFQLLGFDFILDKNLNVWLLEVNGSPMIAEDLRDDMVSDLIDISIVPHTTRNASQSGGRPNQFQSIYTHH